VSIKNAGINGDQIRKPFHEISEEEWDRMMAVNVKGMFFCAKAVFPYMEKEGKGKIINLCSTTIFKGVPDFLHYVSSKGAIAAFTRSLAREVGEYGINVNAIAPGFTVSDIFKDSPAEYKRSRATAWRPRRAFSMNTSSNAVSRLLRPISSPNPPALPKSVSGSRQRSITWRPTASRTSSARRWTG